MKFGSSKNPPTKKQRAVLRFIVAFWGEHMRCPSVREIVAALSKVMREFRHVELG